MSGNNNSGAPPKLTEERYALIIRCRQKGLPWVHCASIAGICEKSLQTWRKIGKDDIERGKDSVYSRFLLDLKKAFAEWIQSQMDIVEKAGKKGQWTAAMTLLERRDPDNFSLKQKQEIQHLRTPGEPLEIKVTIDK